MALLRDKPKDFQQAILAASAKLKISTWVIEKDYWITQLLREIRGAHYGRFIMKGGTSLSKGYDLIQRFSEDVDLLLIPQGRDGDATRVEDIMAAIEATARNTTGRDTRRERAEEGVAMITIVPYPGVLEKYDADAGPEVRIDHGVPGGPLPNEARNVRALVEAAFEGDQGPNEFDDLAPFVVSMLHPARTLVEKLCIVSTIGRRIEGGNPLVRSREARHFYDIWCLLDEERSPALEYLRSIDKVAEIFDDCAQITERFYGSTPERPSDGFAASSIFNDSAIDAVRKSYDKMCAKLVYPGAHRPSIDDVVERVLANSSDL